MCQRPSFPLPSKTKWHVPSTRMRNSYVNITHNCCSSIRHCMPCCISVSTPRNSSLTPDIHSDFRPSLPQAETANGPPHRRGRGVPHAPRHRLFDPRSAGMASGRTRAWEFEKENRGHGSASRQTGKQFTDIEGGSFDSVILKKNGFVSAPPQYHQCSTYGASCSTVVAACSVLRRNVSCRVDAKGSAISLCRNQRVLARTSKYNRHHGTQSQSRLTPIQARDDMTPSGTPCYCASVGTPWFVRRCTSARVTLSKPKRLNTYYTMSPMFIRPWSHRHIDADANGGDVGVEQQSFRGRKTAAAPGVNGGKSCRRKVFRGDADTGGLALALHERGTVYWRTVTSPTGLHGACGFQLKSQRKKCLAFFSTRADFHGIVRFFYTSTNSFLLEISLTSMIRTRSDRRPSNQH